jgi:hypothetical protein
MSNQQLRPGTMVMNAETNDEGQLLGPFVRKGERWWTVNWRDAGTQSQREADILQ